jgi:hypothetical protein
MDLEQIYNIVMSYALADKIKGYQSSIQTAERLKNIGVLTQEEFDSVAEYIKKYK